MANREIKFRYFYHKDKKMYKVINVSMRFTDEPFNRVFIAKESLPGEPTNLRDDSVNGVLMQYTGLKDITGKEIYEDDIIEYDKRIGVIKWTGHGFNGVYTNSDGSWDDEWEDGIQRREKIELKGNIYENESLLRDGEN